MPLQLRRGLQAERDSLVTDQIELLPGEPLWCTDTGNLYIGVAATVGGVHVNAPPVIDLADYTGTIGGGLEPFINADTTTIDLENNITTDIIPRTDLAYDLGSSTRKFNKIWLGTDGIAIGDTVITTNLAGTVISLPTGSTVGGQLISTFPGIDDGDSFKININGSDDNILVDYDNREFLGNIVTNSIVSPDINPVTIESAVVMDQGIRVIQPSGLSLGSTLEMYSNTASESYVTVYRRSRGTTSARLTVSNGDNLGRIRFSGYDGANFISSGGITSSVSGAVSTGIIPTRLGFTVMNSSGSLVESFAILPDGSRNTFFSDTFTTNTSSSSPIVILTHHDDAADTSNIVLARSRGNSTVSTAVSENDPIFDLGFAGHDGTTFSISATIRSTVDGSVSSSVVPGRIEFLLTDTSGSHDVRAQIKNNGELQVDNIASFSTGSISLNSIPILPTFADESAANSAVGSPVNGMMYYDAGANRIKGYQNGSWVVLQP